MKRWLVSAILLALLVGRAGAQPVPSLDELTAAVRKLAVKVLPADAPERALRGAALKHARDVVNRQDRAAWAAITSKQAWEKYRDARLALLRQSLGSFPEAPKAVRVLTTKRIEGDGFVIENLVYESRPGLVVTANLYVPAKPSGPMPGLVVIPSHHNPKTQGELQDMGMTWARAGCLVLVPDMLGHGERRQHPFATAKSYSAPFKLGRQDYYFRYNVGVQLQLVGESLMGWMVWDLMRGIDVLRQRPGMARDKIVVLGSVAGGGDPAAVLAALDPRVAAVAAFNFGGPQPETQYPLPDGAAAAFNYMGGGSWESTRNLRLSGRDGFLPWTIVGAVAPRGLIYAHEFAWDAERDPVWRRLQTIYGFYDAADKLAFVHGRGSVQGKPPDATHCNNIGPEHRKGIHAALKRWFGIEAQEYRNRLPAADLQCLSAEAVAQFKPRPVAALADALAGRRLADARDRRAQLPAQERRAALQAAWTKLLGLPLRRGGQLTTVATGTWSGNHRWKTQLLRHPDEPHLAVPILWLLPAKPQEKTPAVVAIAHAGKAGFLAHRAETIARLLQAGVAVCLPDLRGTGELRPARGGRGRTSSDTALSATEWMHGRTVLGTQLQELLLLLDTLPAQGFGPAALWGDSFAPVNAVEAKVAVPLEADGQPHQCEPMGGLAALLAGLFAPPDTIRAIHVRGSLASYRSLLADAFVDVPHDALVPGVLTVGDVDDVAAAWAPRPLSVTGAVDGHDRLLSANGLTAAALAAWLGGR